MIFWIFFGGILLIAGPVLAAWASAIWTMRRLRGYSKKNLGAKFVILAASWLALALGSLAGLFVGILINRFVFDYSVLSHALRGAELFNWGYGPAVTGQSLEYFQYTAGLLIISAVVIGVRTFRPRRKSGRSDKSSGQLLSRV